MGKLYLVRHGETVANAGGKLQGWMDAELNEKGRSQARDGVGDIRLLDRHGERVSRDGGTGLGGHERILLGFGSRPATCGACSREEDGQDEHTHRRPIEDPAEQPEEAPDLHPPRIRRQVVGHARSLASPDPPSRAG